MSVQRKGTGLAAPPGHGGGPRLAYAPGARGWRLTRLVCSLNRCREEVGFAVGDVYVPYSGQQERRAWVTLALGRQKTDDASKNLVVQKVHVENMANGNEGGLFYASAFSAGVRTDII